MKNSLWVLGLFMLARRIFVSAQNVTQCPIDRWGPDCMNVCGQCYTIHSNLRKCNVLTGECRRGCAGGYKGIKCDEAVCDNDCAGTGLCIHPGICANCGDISKVAPNCDDIRLRGLIGSLISFCVIIFAITFCSLGSIWYKRRASKAVRL